jgi:hypothetical protein
MEEDEDDQCYAIKCGIARLGARYRFSHEGRWPFSNAAEKRGDRGQSRSSGGVHVSFWGHGDTHWSLNCCATRAANHRSFCLPSLFLCRLRKDGDASGVTVAGTF